MAPGDVARSPRVEVGRVHREMRALADPQRAAFVRRFFKTAPGEYGAGDRFLGLTVPQVRRVARKHDAIPLPAVRALLKSPWHEERLLALFILVRQYERGTSVQREAIYRMYLANTARINNWDLVDCSASAIVGAHLSDRARSELRRLARSPRLWERRIAIIATHFFIKHGEVGETLRIARLLLDDEHDLIHKAVGWMLREAGKRDRAALETFLRRRGRRMPRTMLRYAIERFPAPLRRRYLTM